MFLSTASTVFRMPPGMVTQQLPWTLLGVSMTIKCQKSMFENKKNDKMCFIRSLLGCFYFPLNTRKNFFLASGTQHYNRSPREGVESPLQEVFKYNLDTILFHVLWEDPGVPSSLTLSVILWFFIIHPLSEWYHSEETNPSISIQA